MLAYKINIIIKVLRGSEAESNIASVESERARSQPIETEYGKRLLPRGATADHRWLVKLEHKIVLTSDYTNYPHHLTLLSLILCYFAACHFRDKG